MVFNGFRSAVSMVLRRWILPVAGLTGMGVFVSACHEPSAPVLGADRVIAPEQVFAQMIQKSHHKADAAYWVGDILNSLDTVKTSRTNESMCAVMAVIEQESGYVEDPAVAGLGALLEKKIESMGHNLALRVALELRLQQTMSDGKTFRAAIKGIKTERDLSNWYDEFTASKFTGPILKQMGKSVDDVVSTVGSMQVSVDYARSVSGKLGLSNLNIREMLYTRKGGVLYGTAHLFYYPANYTQMIYRFADFNAGHYASRNAGFQTMVGQLSGKPLNADGDLISHHEGAERVVSKTQSAVMQLFVKKAPHMTLKMIEEDLALEKSIDFEQSATYKTVAELYLKKYPALVTQAIPKISLKSEKITRNLTTEWYANSVNRRYVQCLAVAKRSS